LGYLAEISQSLVAVFPLLRTLKLHGPGNTLYDLIVWQRPFLLTLGVLELIVAIPTAVFGLLLGYHGFVAGEMGTMVGILALGVLVPLAPYAVLRVVAMVGLWRRKRWAAILTTVLSGIGAVGAVVVAHDAVGVLVVILLYAGTTAWAALGCLKHPGFGAEPDRGAP